MLRVDDARVDLRERLVVDAEAVLHVGPEVLDHHVGLLDQAQEDREAFRRLQVERDAALVAVQVLEVRPSRGPPGLAAPPLRRLDLDDVGAPVGELAHAVGPARTRVRSSTVKRDSAWEARETALRRLRLAYDGPRSRFRRRHSPI